MGFIKRIWNDSVFSKVIATILSPYILAALAAIKGFFNETGYLADLKAILCYDVSIPVWAIPILVYVLIYATWQSIRLFNNRRIEKTVIRHQGPYITFKGNPQDQCYCAVCWDRDHKKTQLPHYYDETFECPICGNKGSYDIEKHASLYPPIMRF